MLLSFNEWHPAGFLLDFKDNKGTLYIPIDPLFNVVAVSLGLLLVLVIYHRCLPKRSALVKSGGLS